MSEEKEKKPLVIEHDPYTVDLLRYEELQSIGLKVDKLPANRFTGKRVRQDKSKLAQMKRRRKRLERKGLTVGMFAS